MSNPYCNDDPGRPEACNDNDITVKKQGKETSCDNEPAKLNRDFPFCTNLAVPGGLPNVTIQPQVDNVFSFEVSNDANLPFTFEWWLGCPESPIRQLDPSEVEFIDNQANKSTISFRPSHLEATGLAVVVDDTPGSVVVTTTGLFAIAKSRCGDLFSDCINELDKLPHDIQEIIHQFNPQPVSLAVKELVVQCQTAILTSHFVREFINQVSFIPEGPNFVKEFVAQVGGVWTHPDDDQVFP